MEGVQERVCPGVHQAISNISTEWGFCDGVPSTAQSSYPGLFTNCVQTLTHDVLMDSPTQIIGCDQVSIT